MTPIPLDHRGDRHHRAGRPHDNADGRRLRRVRARDDQGTGPPRVWAAARAEGRIGGRREKLDSVKRREIAESVISGRKTGAEMASIYNVSAPTVSRILAAHTAPPSAVAIDSDLRGPCGGVAIKPPLVDRGAVSLEMRRLNPIC